MLITPFLLLISALQSASGAATFSKDVAPILEKHCIRCHRAGGIASFAQFTSYESVRPWAEAMKEAVSIRYMPPWSADAEHSLKFRNDPRLSDAEIATIRAWADAGAAKGDASSRLDLAASAGNWNGPGGRKPDLVISMTSDAVIPATGDLPYVRFLVKLPLTEDKWIAACQARPGNASVVHHMAITEVQLPEGVPVADIDGLEAFYRKMGVTTPILQPVVGPRFNHDVIDMLGIYTPGTTLEEYGDDSGKLLKAGANRYIDFNIHYSANGTESKDRSEVAFWFRDSAPRHQIYRVSMSGDTVIANGKELQPSERGERAEGTQVVIPPIPAGAANYELVSVTPFSEPVTVFQFHPHAHFRARDFKYVAVYPDGTELTLLTIPKYDFRWQLAYELATPLQLPAGSKLVVTAHYDNSPNNKFNPAPEKEVLFRAQNLSTDEMFSPFVQYSVDTEDAANPVAEPSKAQIPISKAEGCLIAPKTGSKNWTLSSGAETFQLFGISAFHPEKHGGEKVLVKGMTTGGGKQWNVTSMLTVAATCSK